MTPKLTIMQTDAPEPYHSRRQPYPLSSRVALVTGVSRRIGIGYTIARRLATLGASLFLHHYVSHDQDQPWGADPGGADAVADGFTQAHRLRHTRGPRGCPPRLPTTTLGHSR